MDDPSHTEPRKLMSRVTRAALIILTFTTAPRCHSAEPLQLERTISLEGVKGRIDHLAVDVKNQRLFIAALGNNTLEVIDLKAGSLLKQVPKPVQEGGVPIIVGGSGRKRTPRLAARYAGEFNVPFASAEDNARFFAGVREACDEAGRDHGSMV